MKLPELHEIESAAEIVYGEMPPTPQYRWPMLRDRLGTEIWVKHENQTPVGAFKIRGGLNYFASLARAGALPGGVISATRGNHGQSVAYAASRYDVPATIVVPHGNSAEKNAAMRALGAELIEQGDDFQASLEFATSLADERRLRMVPSFDPLLVAGVATYSLELFRAVPDLDVAYVPIGLGSGICGMVSARRALNLNMEIVGVVSNHARAYALSFAGGRSVDSPVSTRLADGMACRRPHEEALQIMLREVDRIVEVSDEEIAEAMRVMFECTHNTCEGAGAASMAAAMQEKGRLGGRCAAVVVSGGNIDRDLFADVLAEKF